MWYTSSLKKDQGMPQSRGGVVELMWALESDRHEVGLNVYHLLAVSFSLSFFIYQVGMLNTTSEGYFKA